MTDKSAEHARETLNALIAGGYFPRELLKLQEDRLILDKAALRYVETQLHEHYTETSRLQKADREKASKKTNQKNLVQRLA